MVPPARAETTRPATPAATRRRCPRRRPGRAPWRASRVPARREFSGAERGGGARSSARETCSVGSSCLGSRSGLSTLTGTATADHNHRSRARAKSAVQAVDDSVEHHCHTSTSRSSVTAINRHHKPIEDPWTRTTRWRVSTGPSVGSISQHDAYAVRRRKCRAALGPPSSFGESFSSSHSRNSRSSFRRARSARFRTNEDPRV